jgi:hypothetical protein
MRWSKVRKLTEESFAESVRGRVTVHVTNADPHGTRWQDTCHKSWISVDGQTIAHLDRHARLLTLRIRDEEGATKKVERRLVQNYTKEALEPDATDDVMDLNDAAWQYVHSNVAESLDSPDAFVQSLAILSARVGRQRLRRLEQRELHPLVRTLLEFRLRAEAALHSNASTRTAS